jgi:hypothetical protein
MQFRVFVQHLRGQFARPFEQVRIGGQVGKAQQRIARLARAQKLAGAANLQVAPGDLEAVVGLGHGAQALLGGFAHAAAVVGGIQQHAGRGRRAAPYPAAQLVQLRSGQNARHVR